MLMPRGERVGVAIFVLLLAGVALLAVWGLVSVFPYCGRGTEVQCTGPQMVGVVGCCAGLMMLGVFGVLLLVLLWYALTGRDLS